MGRTYRRSSDEGDYYREQKLRREQEKRNARHKREHFDEDDFEPDTPKRKKQHY